MKRTVCFFILSILLTSCANVMMPTATATAQPTVTFTPTHTSTPTLTPTITPTPTKTPDPNMPPDAMGKNSSGEYTKTAEENGRIVTYVWKQIQFGNDVENGVTGHWFESRMAKGPINLTGYGENVDYYNVGDIKLNLTVYSVENLRDLDSVGYLYHPDGPSDYDTKKLNGANPNGAKLKAWTLASTITDDLFFAYYDLISGKPGSRGMDRYQKYDEKYAPGPGHVWTDASSSKLSNDLKAFVNAMNSGGGIHVGDDLWQPSKGYDVYFIDEESASEDPSMHLSVQAYTKKNWYWKVMVNDGKLIAIIAPSEWLKSQLSWPKAKSRERIFRAVSLYLLQAVINGQNPNEDIGFLSFQDYGSAAGPDLSIGGVSITTSFIAFTPNP